jgi:pimeloyl-ACP methyl ester carboxylesterase
VLNTRRQNIEAMLLTTKHANTCIVYAHGLGSNKLEALSIAKSFLKQGYDVCSFDFSSSGRSEGDYTSYGLLEQDDVHAVLATLDNGFRYDKYVLWGRSMGSAAIILSQGSSPHRKVDCLILDSPFSSF